MITIQNEKLSMGFALTGAEPQSLFSKESGNEYLWNGDPRFWPRRAPLLFPMTGSTKEGKVEGKGKTYTMPTNGFARDLDFSLLTQSSDSASFELQDSEATLQYYPYGFRLRVTYTLLDDGFKAEAEVYAKEDLPFTFGWHPAFSLDINGKGTPLDSYSISFETEECVDRKTPVDGVFVTDKKFLDNSKTLRLSRALTDKGPIVLNGLKSKHVRLTSEHGEHGILVERGNLDTLVIWTVAPKHAQYLCIEPMHSFGDTKRAFALAEMDEVLTLDKGETKRFHSTFKVF